MRSNPSLKGNEGAKVQCGVVCVRAGRSSVCRVGGAGEVSAPLSLGNMCLNTTIPRCPRETAARTAAPRPPWGERERERESYGVPNPGPNLPVGSGPSNMGSNLVRGNVCVCARPPALSASLPPSDQPTHHRDIGKLLSKARFEPEGRRARTKRERDVSLGCLTSIKCTRHACVWRGLKLMCGMSGGTYPMGS